jgi:hypothetical protein
MKKSTREILRFVRIDRECLVRCIGCVVLEQQRWQIGAALYCLEWDSVVLEQHSEQLYKKLRFGQMRDSVTPFLGNFSRIRLFSGSISLIQYSRT